MSHLALFLTWATVSAGFVLAVGAWRGRRLARRILVPEAVQIRADLTRRIPGS